MQTQLLDVLNQYFAAINENQPDIVAQCFTEQGTVLDEGQTIIGQAAIEQWAKKAQEQYKFAISPVETKEVSEKIEVLAKVSGDFPGSPVILEHTFKLDGKRIATLEIQ